MNAKLIHDRRFADALGQESSTAVSRYEVVSGFLVSSVGLVGIITALLALLVFLNMQWDKSVKSPMFVFDELPGFKNPEGIEEDFREPGVEELRKWMNLNWQTLWKWSQVLCRLFGLRLKRLTDRLPK